MRARVDDRPDEETRDPVDVAEHGRAADGEETTLDRRLFMQLLAFGGASNTAALVSALEAAGVEGALYEDVNDPSGVALLVLSESPDSFVSEIRGFLQAAPFAELEPKPELTMLGRTYAIGHEQDLDEALVERPRRRVLDPVLKWAIWYPLRRAGSFEQLSRNEQNAILMEHGGVGMAFGRAGLGYDIRLACHGLDKLDNDFVVGLLGLELHPLSIIVQRMRKTRQTSLHLERLGPFFVGRVAWQSLLRGDHPSHRDMAAHPEVSSQSRGVIADRPGEADTEPTSPFLRACRGLPVERTPVWLLRQAGRYMPEYRALRERHSLLDLIRTPELAAQVTLMPVDAFGVDAAIVFSDILPPLVGMGLELDFVKGDGPRIGNPLSSPRRVDLLGTPPAEETMSATLGAIMLVRRELEPRDVPVIGFAGAPFTLASYAIEGGTSRDFTKTKAFMFSEPAAWRRLLTKLVTVQADYLLSQARAGAQALQVFDSWAGRALGREDYLRYVAPHNRDLYAAVARAGVPVINFSLGVSAYLSDAAACGGDVVGLDWQLPLDEAWAEVGFERPVQGNLDPAALLAPWRELRARIDDVLERAAGRPGHVFNVGHGLVPQTPVDNVRRLVEHVRERPSA